MKEFVTNIYEILDKLQNTIYVGRSVNPKSRFDCFKRRHPRVAFSYRVIAKFPISFACGVEKILISSLRPKYNKVVASSVGHTGRKHSEIARSKMSIAHIGHTPTNATRRKLHLANVGKVLSSEHRNKISRGNKDKVRSKECVEQMRTRMLGKKFSTEHKNKISAALKGRIKSEKHRKNLSIALKGKQQWLGKKHSIETKKKLSEAAKLQWARQKCL